MLQPLKPPPDVDFNCAGLLTICPDAFRGLLGLDDRHAVIGFALDHQGRLQVEIAGEDMPPAGLSPAPVTIVCHKQPDQAIELSWAHKPEKRWRLP